MFKGPACFHVSVLPSWEGGLCCQPATRMVTKRLPQCVYHQPSKIWQWSVEEGRDVSSSMFLLKSKALFPKGPNQVSSVPSSLQCFIGECLSYTSHWQGHRISRIDLVKHRAMWRRTAYLDRTSFILQKKDGFSYTSLTCILEYPFLPYLSCKLAMWEHRPYLNQSPKSPILF